MLKKIIYYLLISFIVISFSIAISKTEENPQRVNKKISNNSSDDLNDYKIIKEKDFLSCFKPLFIDSIDTIYIKNKKDQVVYKIEMYGSQGTCQWYRDRMYFRPNANPKLANQTANLYEDNIFLYLNTNLKILFKVTKLLPYEVGIDNITIPYFVMLYNNKNDAILEQQNFTLNIKLTEAKEQIIESEYFILNDFSILGKTFINIEMLAGIYFNHSPIQK